MNGEFTPLDIVVFDEMDWFFAELWLVMVNIIKRLISYSQWMIHLEEICFRQVKLSRTDFVKAGFDEKLCYQKEIHDSY